MNWYSRGTLDAHRDPGSFDFVPKTMERVMGIEPTTTCLGSSCHIVSGSLSVSTDEGKHACTVSRCLTISPPVGTKIGTVNLWLCF
jgi:hypothetical protein